MAKRLETLAYEINYKTNYRAKVTKGSRPFRNTKRRNKLVVKDPEGNIVYEHDAGNPFRKNSQAERWVGFLISNGKHYCDEE